MTATPLLGFFFSSCCCSVEDAITLDDFDHSLQEPAVNNTNRRFRVIQQGITRRERQTCESTTTFKEGNQARHANVKVKAIVGKEVSRY